MPEFYAVLMSRRLSIEVTMDGLIWVVLIFLILGLCALFSEASGPMRRISRSALIAIVLVVLAAWGNSVYAFVFLMFPAVYWDCGWCWIW